MLYWEMYSKEAHAKCWYYPKLTILLAFSWWMVVICHFITVHMLLEQIFAVTFQGVMFWECDSVEGFWFRWGVFLILHCASAEKRLKKSKSWKFVIFCSICVSVCGARVVYDVRKAVSTQLHAKFHDFSNPVAWLSTVPAAPPLQSLFY